MKTNLEKAKKEIETKELLNIPYNSEEIMSVFVPEEVSVDLVCKLTSDKRGNFGYKYFDADNNEVSHGRLGVFELFNRLVPKFHLKPSYRFNKDITEQYRVAIRINNSAQEYSNNYTSKSELPIYACIQNYVEAQSHIPNEIKFTISSNRATNEEYRRAWYKCEHGDATPEQVMAEIFTPKVNAEYVTGKELRSQYRNPFSRGSIKHRLYLSNKDVLQFCIEYLYGKKLNFSMPCYEIYKVLLGLPNNRFNINDTVKAKELLHSLEGYSVKSQYQKFQKIGMKPATDLSRWVKRRNLDLNA